MVSISIQVIMAGGSKKTETQINAIHKDLESFKREQEHFKQNYVSKEELQETVGKAISEFMSNHKSKGTVQTKTKSKASLVIEESSDQKKKKKQPGLLAKKENKRKAQESDSGPAKKSKRNILESKKGKSIESSFSHLEAVEVCVKADDCSLVTIGNCLNSQRVLMTLEEKGVPYKPIYIDSKDKPDWFLQVNPRGRVPFIKIDGNWSGNTDSIVALLERNFPSHPLPFSPEVAHLGSKILEKSLAYVKSQDENDEAKKDMLDALRALDEHMKSNGPFANGNAIKGVDCSLAPTLYHAQVILRKTKAFEIPSDLTDLHKYMDLVFLRESFKNSFKNSDS